MMGPYKNLLVWQKGLELSKHIYEVTKYFPNSEQYGLISQMRRAVVSIPSNIAEGYGRNTNPDLLHFLHIALGSSNELDTQIILSKAFNYISDEQFDLLNKLNSDVNKMLKALINTRDNSQLDKPIAIS